KQLKYNNGLSLPKPNTSGVIQGSVLVPLLFIIYINDINNVIKHGRPYLYADDLKI
ncbi:Reverse transcriptase SjR1, partial [Schistosoma japonicum]